MFGAMEVVRRRTMAIGNLALSQTADRMLQLMQCLELREWTPKTIDKARLEKLADVTDNFRSHPKVWSRLLCLQ